MSGGLGPCVAYWPCLLIVQRRAEDLFELVWKHHFKLVVPAVARPLVRPPPDKYGRVAKAPSLQVVVLDLADPLDPQGLPRKILARTPAALASRHAGELAGASLRPVAPWVILENGSSMGGFTSQQIQSLAFMFWKLNGRSDQFYVVFFGLWCFLTGYLIFRSTFMPKVIGILLSIDGLGWMMFVYPPLGSSLFTFIAIAAGLAEIPLLLWLLIMGVNPQRWNEQAAAAGIASNA